MLKKSELKELKLEEAEIKLSDVQDALMNLQFQHSLQQLDNPIRLKNVRREIAQLRTIIKEFHNGIRE
ncbi:MAG: 50S ribosomal protein L29 [Candidatus Marinimicrobia bacterium]|nr:50S ribosomal protein L29 [Candidatus Neomarinimicrobiota bacterium]